MARWCKVATVLIFTDVISVWPANAELYNCVCTNNSEGN
jgi:hypothetical protein